jgi:hypothetical protein
MSLRVGLIAVLLLPLPAAADTTRDPDEFRVDSTWVNVDGAVFEVNARIVYPLDERVRSALESGATVHYDLQAVVEKQSRYWFDNTLVDVVLRRSLNWSALTQRYVLRDVKTGEQRVLDSLEEALEAAGQVENWPVVVETQLDPDATYRIRVRAGYRRGNLPSSLLTLMPWSDGWNRRTDWNAWILPR